VTGITARPRWQDAAADLTEGRVETDRVIRITINSLATGIYRPAIAGYAVYSSERDYIVVDAEGLREFAAREHTGVGSAAHIYTIPPSRVGMTGEISLSPDAATFGIFWQALGFQIHPQILQGPLVLTTTAVTEGDPTGDVERRAALPVAGAGRSYLSRLAESSPDDLLGLIRGGHLPPEELTYAVEIAGSMKCENVIETLLPLLASPSPLVREGTVYGLAWKRQDPRVASALRDVATNDPSHAVRDAAEGALDD
jgi:hypothetical protein